MPAAVRPQSIWPEHLPVPPRRRRPPLAVWRLIAANLAGLFVNFIRRKDHAQAVIGS
jgi:hypothetical protein